MKIVMKQKRASYLYEVFIDDVCVGLGDRKDCEALLCEMTENEQKARAIKAIMQEAKNEK